jgi:hypothetical protein
VGMVRLVKVVPLGRVARVMGGVAPRMLTACPKMGVNLLLGRVLRFARDV